MLKYRRQSFHELAKIFSIVILFRLRFNGSRWRTRSRDKVSKDGSFLVYCMIQTRSSLQTWIVGSL